uniref:Uncharacterized protein n=1 Tax=Oryza glumipatula TaxID=40148 RepID=A0A0E0ASB0_9ORYZ
MVDRIVPAASSSGSVLGMQVHVEPWPELGLLWQPGIPAQSLGGWSKREISTAHEAGIFRPNLRGIPGERTPVSGGQEKILARSASASSRATRSGHRRDSSGEMRHRRDSSSGETPPPGLLRRNATTTPGISRRIYGKEAQCKKGEMGTQYIILDMGGWCHFGTKYPVVASSHLLSHYRYCFISDNGNGGS